MIELGSKTYTVEQKRLREWISLSEILISLGDAVEHRDRDGIADSLCLYVSTAFHLDKGSIDDLPWLEISSAFNDIYKENSIDLSHIAFTRGEQKVEKKEIWDYPGRMWWVWVHDFAKQFGWDIEYIANLDVLEAFSLLQEILLDQQFTKEWEWTLSEYSLKYDKNTKKSEPNPLPKPDWMKITPKAMIEPIKKIDVPEGMIPVGNIITHKNFKP